MDEPFLYHWMTETGFNHIKENGIRGEEGWFYTLFGNEMGGLYEYIPGRLKPGDKAYAIRMPVSNIISNEDNHCFIDYSQRIGDPAYDRMYKAAFPCRSEGVVLPKMCGSGCNPDEEFEGFESYWEYLGDHFEKCGGNPASDDKKRRWHEEFMEAMFEIECHIPPDDMEFTVVDDALGKLRSDQLSKVKLKWKRFDEVKE